MTRNAFDKIKSGLEDAVAFARGDTRMGVAHIPDEIDIRAIRKATGLTQAAFAARFGFNLGRLRDLEQGRTRPDSVARAYLLVIQKDVEAVERALDVA
ncbi:MAG: helix-turn-helix domain-containing protein [Hyphomicrobiaceae bacterium]|nr:helix-turn-helix domain-containing protein [Hyphomicrobiaceae bacterium]